ncbi:hypothetical protein PVAND_016903 [Polypedilum vanderplanki]|uniref:Uncharacterized protein n=1 Tax=Polypedilum vanderplanki TaxID=319348 RepID=A0A9J6BH57_POLVA|nr:hypothetical protein PVAND_016903 [Polypedilum vanderplanki]
MYKEQSTSFAQSLPRVQTTPIQTKKPTQKKYRKTSFNSDDDILQLDPLDSIYTDQNETFSSYNYYHRKKYMNDEMRRRNEEHETKIMERDLQLRKVELLILTREDEIKTLKTKHKQELIEIQREMETEFRQKILDIRQDHEDEVKKLQRRLNDYEKEMTEIRKQLFESKTEVDVTKAILKSTNDRNVTLVEKIKDLMSEKMTRRSNTKHKGVQVDENSNNENAIDQISDLDQIMLNLVENTQKKWRKKTRESQERLREEKAGSISKTSQDSSSDLNSETSNRSQNDNFLNTFQPISPNELLNKTESSSDQQSDSSEKDTKNIKFPNLSESNQSTIVKKIIPVRRESICMRPIWQKTLKMKENVTMTKISKTIEIKENLNKEENSNLTQIEIEIDQKSDKITPEISQNLEKETLTIKNDKIKKNWMKNFKNMPKELEESLYEWMKSKNIEIKDLNDEKIIQKSDEESSEILTELNENANDEKETEILPSFNQKNLNFLNNSEQFKETSDNLTEIVIDEDKISPKITENDKSLPTDDKISSKIENSSEVTSKIETSANSITIKSEEIIKTEVDSESDTNLQQEVTKVTKNDSQTDNDKILSKSSENFSIRENYLQPQNDMIEAKLQTQVESTTENNFSHSELKMEETSENEINLIQKEIHSNLIRKNNECEIESNKNLPEKSNDDKLEIQSCTKSSTTILNYSLFKEKYDELFSKLDNNGAIVNKEEQAAQKIEVLSTQNVNNGTDEHKEDETLFPSNNVHKISVRMSRYDQTFPSIYGNLFTSQKSLNDDENSKYFQRSQSRQYSPSKYDRSLKECRTSPHSRQSYDSLRDDKSPSRESDRRSHSNERTTRFMHKKSSYYYNNDYRDYRSSQNRSRSPHYDDRRSNSPYYEQSTSRRFYDNRRPFNNDQKYSKFYKSSRSPTYDRNRSSSSPFNDRYRKRSPQNDYKQNWRQNEYFQRKNFIRNNREFSPTRKQHFYRENNQRFDFRRNFSQDDRQFYNKFSHFDRHSSYDGQNKNFYQKNQRYKFDENWQKKPMEESCKDMEMQRDKKEEIADDFKKNDDDIEKQKKTIFKRRHSVYVEKYFDDSERNLNFQNRSLSNENLDKIQQNLNESQKLINPFLNQEKSSISTSEDLRKLTYKNLFRNQNNEQQNVNIDGKRSEDYVKIDFIESPDEIPNKFLKFCEKDPRLRKNLSQNDEKIQIDEQQPKTKRIRLDSIGSSSDRSSLNIPITQCYQNDKKIERRSSISSQHSNSSSTTSNIKKQNLSTHVSTNYEAKILNFSSENEISKLDEEILKFCRENSENEKNSDEKIESEAENKKKEKENQESAGTINENKNKIAELMMEFEAENEIVSDGQSEYSMGTPTMLDFAQNDLKIFDEKENKGIQIISVVSINCDDKIETESSKNENSKNEDENLTKCEENSKSLVNLIENGDKLLSSKKRLTKNEVNSTKTEENSTKNDEKSTKMEENSTKVEESSTKMKENSTIIGQKLSKNAQILTEEFDKNSKEIEEKPTETSKIFSIDEILAHLHEESKQNDKKLENSQENSEDSKIHNKNDTEILEVQHKNEIKKDDKNIEENSQIFILTSHETSSMSKSDCETICDIEREIRSIIGSDSSELVTFKAKDQEKDPLEFDSEEEAQDLIEEIEIKAKKERKRRKLSKDMKKKSKKSQKQKKLERKDLIIPAVYNLRKKSQKKSSTLIYSDISSDESSQSSDTINKLREIFNDEERENSKLKFNGNKTHHNDKQQIVTKVYRMKDDVVDNDKNKKPRRRKTIEKRQSVEEFCGNRLIDTIRNTCNQLISESSSENESNETKLQIHAINESEKIEIDSQEKVDEPKILKSSILQKEISNSSNSKPEASNFMPEISSSSISKPELSNSVTSKSELSNLQTIQQSNSNSLNLEQSNSNSSILQQQLLKSSILKPETSILQPEVQNTTILPPQQPVSTEVTQVEISTAHSLLQLASSPSILKFDAIPKTVSDVLIKPIKKRRQSMFDPSMSKKTNALFEREPSLLKYLSIDSSWQPAPKSIINESQKTFKSVKETILQRHMDEIGQIQAPTVQQQFIQYQPSMFIQNNPTMNVTNTSDVKIYQHNLMPKVQTIPMNISHLVPPLKVDYQQLSVTSPIQNETVNNFMPIIRTNSLPKEPIIEQKSNNSPPRSYGGSLITSDQLNSCQSSPIFEIDKNDQEITKITLSAVKNSQENQDKIFPLFSPSPQPFVVEDVARYEARRAIRLEILKIVTDELNVFYELKKFESDKPKELFKAMARTLTSHFSEINPDKMPSKNEIKNYIFEIFYNKDVIKSSEDFLLDE